MNARRLLPDVSSVMKLHSKKATIQHFADDFGLVYFGYVNQLDDEHRIVRGLTVSVDHHDNHYCIGSYEGYDVAYVERSDELRTPKLNKKSKHTWQVMEFDLYTKKSLPHFFIGLHGHSESFYMQLFTKYPVLRSIRLGNLGEHVHDFIMKYRVYASPENTIAVEKLIAPSASELISKHFGTLAVEVHDSSLYIYSEMAVPTLELLEAMIKNGVWLARHIDEAAESI